MELLKSLSGKLMRLNSSVNPPTPCPFENVTKLNDSVYELYKPLNDPNVEILFFHGLQVGDHSNSYWSTWSSGDGTQLWPQTWLSEVFPDAHILSISYDTLLKSAQQETLDLHTVGSNLIPSLVVLAGIGQKPGCPIILVGHSFGGLVIKQLCTQAHREIHSGQNEVNIKQFLTNVRGCFFYATPHHGVPFNMAGSFVKGNLLEYVNLLSADSARLGEDFRRLCTKEGWQTAGVGEGNPIRMGSFRGIVVPEASARDGSFSIVLADHISICKPKDTFAPGFQRLVAFIEDILDRKG